MIRATRFEKTRLLSARALQLSLSAPPLVKPDAEDTPYTLAKREMEKKVIPMTALRRLPDGKVIRIDDI